MKNIYILLVLIVILNSCITEKPNVYLTTGTDYGMKPPQWTIGCNYDSLNFKVIDRIVKKFGNHYSLLNKQFEDEYKWDNVIFPEISNDTLSVKIIRKINTLQFSDNKKHNLENITIYIKKTEKDYLHPLRFQNRIRTKKFLVNILEF